MRARLETLEAELSALAPQLAEKRAERDALSASVAALEASLAQPRRAALRTLRRVLLALLFAPVGAGLAAIVTLMVVGVAASLLLGDDTGLALAAVVSLPVGLYGGYNAARTVLQEDPKK